MLLNLVHRKRPSTKLYIRLLLVFGVHDIVEQWDLESTRHRFYLTFHVSPAQSGSL
jgi:hypothetical protein